MRLFLADIHLHRVRLFHAATPYPWDSPQTDLAAARKLIERCGYGRRKEELEDAEAAIPFGSLVISPCIDGFRCALPILQPIIFRRMGRAQRNPSPRVARGCRL